MDRSRHDNRSDQWRRRSSARRSRALRWASVPRRLIFANLVAAGALAALTAMQHADSLHEINPQNLADAKPEPITGVASVIDGDTIEIHGQRLRYLCGRRSAESLDDFLAASRPVQCTFITWDRYHRFVGACRRADGASVAAWMVEHGQALDWPRYSHGAYSSQQAKAVAAKVGLWAGNFQAPWDWRASHADDPAPSSQPVGILSRKLFAQSGLSCEPRRYCAQISSCEEAHWYLHNCSWGRKLDRDGDGVACETLC